MSPKYRWLYKILKDYFIHSKCHVKAQMLILKMIKHDIEFFRYNKLLVAIAYMMNKCFNYTDPLLEYRIKRYEVYREEARRISSELARRGVDAVFIKTITAFPKDIADLDLLIRDDKDLQMTENILRDLGYRQRKQGLEQYLWSLKKNDIVVDVELHTSIAAARYRYYPVDLVFKNSIMIEGIRTASPKDDILITIAHSIMKDLYITLADILVVATLMSKHNITWTELFSYAKSLGMATPLTVYLYLMRLLDDEASHLELEYELHKMRRKFFSIISISQYPLRPGLHTVIASYLEMTLTKLKYESPLTVLQEMLSLARGKGIDALIKFLSGIKPPVKKLTE